MSVAVKSHTDDPCPALSLIDGICAALPVEMRRVPTIETLDVDGDVVLRAARIGCCFSYRTPDGTRCVDCPNRPPSATG